MDLGGIRDPAPIPFAYFNPATKSLIPPKNLSGCSIHGKCPAFLMMRSCEWQIFI